MPKIDIYTSPFCGYCSRAKMVLDKKGASYADINIMVVPEGRREMLSRSGGAHTVPQIFIGDIHVGGCSELLALERAGKLDALLAG
ncbi:glutaredoxin 3 [Alloyangia pacifica]|uniref:glutaredoxin 3 n=1 Tax=Alloyangia pacifica TaxID=311180 RepID=UPI001CD26FF1|nr:glutaredoxin 3 [Alloyangia pacifica]MCA0996439.1 glutaredoxin 3 [Alloyangia pacifica]